MFDGSNSSVVFWLIVDKFEAAAIEECKIYKVNYRVAVRSGTVILLGS